eukprot:m.282696 g.282696  ORF g.282696 m.282696 type:complete len:464 (-) comp19859_c0_seq2:264-1655(-)
MRIVGATKPNRAAVLRARAATSARRTAPSEVSKLNDEIASRKKTVAELTATNKEMQEQLDSLKEAHQGITTELSQTSSALGSLQAVHQQLQEQTDAQATSSTEALTSYQDIVEDHRQKLEATHAEIESALSESMALTDALNKARNEAATLQKQNNALLSAAEDNGAAADECSTELQLARTDLENTRLRHTTLLTEIAECNAMYTATEAELNIMKEELQKLTVRATQTASKAAGDESAKKVELEHTRKLIDVMRKQLDDIRTTQQTAETEATALRIEAAEYALKIESVEADIADTKAARDAAQSKLSTSTTTHVSAADVEAARLYVKQLEERIAEYATIEAELAEHRDRQTVSDTLQEQLETELNTMKEECSALRESALKAKQSITDALRGKLQAVQEKNKIAQELAAAKTDLLHAAPANTEDDGEDHLGTLAKLQVDREALQDEETRNAAKIDALEASLNSML